jgi:hypothetical protein
MEPCGDEAAQVREGSLPLEEDLLPGQPDMDVSEGGEHLVPESIPLVGGPAGVVGPAVALDDQPLAHQEIHEPDSVDVPLRSDIHLLELQSTSHFGLGAGPCTPADGPHGVSDSLGKPRLHLYQRVLARLLLTKDRLEDDESFQRTDTSARVRQRNEDGNDRLVVGPGPQTRVQHDGCSRISFPGRGQGLFPVERSFPVLEDPLRCRRHAPPRAGQVDALERWYPDTVVFECAHAGLAHTAPQRETGRLRCLVGAVPIVAEFLEHSRGESLHHGIASELDHSLLSVADVERLAKARRVVLFHWPSVSRQRPVLHEGSGLCG